MSKILNMEESIFELVSRYPEVVDIMVGLGFSDISKPGMLQTAGRFMTLSKGITMKKMDREAVRLAFQSHGFEIVE